jgi:hypothetical protein
MLIYLYDKDSKEYTLTREAQRNPHRPTEFLKPTNSTTEQLPDYNKETETVVYEGHWVIKPDYRGQEALNLETLQFETINYIGDVKLGYQILTDSVREDFEAHRDCYKVKNGELVCIRGTEEFVKYLEDEFNKNFIETNLGYVRIHTNWGNFLTIKPNYDIQVTQAGFLIAGVMVLYHKPDFTQFDSSTDVDEWLVKKGQFKNPKVSQEEYIIFSNQVLERFTSEV